MRRSMYEPLPDRRPCLPYLIERGRQIGKSDAGGYLFGAEAGTSFLLFEIMQVFRRCAVATKQGYDRSMPGAVFPAGGPGGIVAQGNSARGINCYNERGACQAVLVSSQAQDTVVIERSSLIQQPVGNSLFFCPINSAAFRRDHPLTDRIDSGQRKVITLTVQTFGRLILQIVMPCQMQSIRLSFRLIGYSAMQLSFLDMGNDNAGYYLMPGKLFDRYKHIVHSHTHKYYSKPTRIRFARSAGYSRQTTSLTLSYRLSR